MSNWQIRKLKELGLIERGRFLVRPRNDPRYYGGIIPFIQTGNVSNSNGTIRSYTQTLNEKGLLVSKLFPKNSLVISIAANIGDVGKVLFDFSCPDSLVVIQPYKTVNLNWLKYLLESKKLYFKSQSTKNAQANINLQTIKSLKVTCPSYLEQKAIANILETWDIAIEKVEALIAAEEKRFDWLVTHLINKSQHKKRYIYNFISEISNRNKDNTINRVLSVTNHSGFILSGDQFKKSVFSSDLSNYKIVSKFQYAYNPSRINVGSISRLNIWDIGIVSPMYTVFKLNTLLVNNDYFLHWLSSSEIKQRIKKLVQGSVRECVSFSNFGNIAIPFPDLSEQEKIVTILNAAKTEINLYKSLSQKYRTQKRGLMQKLLTGQWRVNSERFTA